MSLKNNLTEDEEEFILLALQSEGSRLTEELKTATIYEQEISKHHVEAIRQKNYIQRKLDAVSKFLMDNIDE